MLEVFEQVQNSQSYRVPHSATAYYSKLVPVVYNQGPFGIFGPIKKLIVSIMGFFKPVPREPSSLSDMKIWAIKTTALACQTLMLGFRAAGFDSCPMEGMDSKMIKRALDLPSDASVVMVVGAGKRASNGIYGPRIRFKEEQFIFEV